MKKQSRGIFFLWTLIVAVVAGGAFLICRHLGIGVTPSAGIPSDISTPGGDGGAGDVAPDVSAVPMQQFSNDGYAFSVPASWNIEQTTSDTIALHPDASSPDVACKIEVSAFSYSAGADGFADWITHRIGADPSLAVVEASSEDVSLSGGTGVKWNGTIDGVPTTLVYAFNDSHAYEIAPSVISGDAGGATQCDDMLKMFLSTLTI